MGRFCFNSPLIPLTTWSRLIGSWLVVIFFILSGETLLNDSLSAFSATWIFLLLFITILTASFGVVKEADHLAEQLGEPYGTLILTLSIVLIEVILIASVLLGPGDFPTIGRDSIFAVMMIIMNLVVGICLLAGSTRNGEQEYNTQGTNSYLSMIVLLTGLALILPNYTSSQGEYSHTQAIGISGITILIYGAFLWMQMRGHRRFFIQPPKGLMNVPEQYISASDALADNNVEKKDNHAESNKKTIIIRSCVLIGLILPIVLLAHYLAIVTDYGIEALGAPPAVGGVLIAIIVFTPESITAVKAAMNNEMQRAINLCQGAFVSTVGLTVPAVLIIGIITGKQVIMGISNAEIVLFAITMLLTMLSFNGQKTSPIQGWMHLAIFAVFGLILFYP
ncbi:calcium:proton antiporter [Providencia rettgeri]|uniref:calcium:proton antiporter n=1 Tax=Providencia rettgeri TaxID=587 RepID=UPI00029BCF99|nr:calcium:proton antiporter [Providencia rettgeri]EKT56635.1 calcium/proton antiporter [Providencia rettgeri Dmel1]